MRHCSRCDQDKNEQAFGPGHKSWCRKCHNEYVLKWRRGEREPRRRRFPNTSGEVTCSLCGVSGFEHFAPSYRSRRRTSGYCKKCSNAYYGTKENPDGSRYQQGFQKKLRAAKRKYLRDIKEQSGCAHCGDRRYQVLAFHHTDPSTKEGVLNVMAAQNASWERIEKEVAKCIVLCSNCHRMEHWRLRQKTRSEAQAS